MNDPDELIVNFIQRSARVDGHPPTVAEIAAAIGRSETATRRKLTRLREEGRVEWDPALRRTIRVQQTDMKAETETI